MASPGLSARPGVSRNRFVGVNEKDREDLRKQLLRTYRGNDLHVLTLVELRELPLLALVAFATRCARRVQPFIKFAYGDPYVGRVRADIDNAIKIAERVASGETLPFDEVQGRAARAERHSQHAVLEGESVALVCAHAAHAAAAALAGDAEEVVVHAGTAHSAGAGAMPMSVEEAMAELVKVMRGEIYTLGNDRFRAATWDDYKALLEMNLGKFPGLGRPIGEAEAARLPLLWPK
jgi:hypothetical protein